MLRHRSFIRLSAFGGALALMAAGCKSSTKPAPAVNLTGSYGLSVFSQGGQSVPLDANDTATLTISGSVYNTVGTGNLAIVTDSGTYTASDTSDVDGLISGPFAEESVITNTGVSGWFSMTADSSTVTEYVTSNGAAVTSTWVRTVE